METRETGSRIYVKVPFEMKDLFKKTFSTAKWDADERRWHISKKSKKKLDEFIEASENVLEELQKRDEELMTLEEKKELKSELDKLSLQIKSERRMNEQYYQSFDLMLEHTDVEKAREELEIEKQNKEKHLQQCKDVFKKICDLDAILECKDVMISCYNKVYSSAKKAYQDAQDEIAHQQKKLLEKGIYSEGLSKLIYMNFNRKDRDNPAEVSLNEIINIKKKKEI